jgi:hypothetical protein
MISEETQGENKTNWTEEEDEKLRILIILKREKNWERISKEIGKSPSQCKNRWKTALSPSIIKITERRKWVPEEDEKLSKLVKKYGTKNWRIIASHLRGRLPKQCRERWINHLDPIIVKGRLTEKEWKVVMDAHEEIGNRWSEIAKLLPGRTPNQIKNHWHAMLRKTNKRRQREYSVGEDSPESNSMSIDMDVENKSNDETYIPQSPPTIEDSPPLVNEDLQPLKKKRRLIDDLPSPSTKLEALVKIAEFMYQYEETSKSIKSSPSMLFSLISPGGNSQTSISQTTSFRLQRTNSLDNNSINISESIFPKEISIKGKKFLGEVKEYSPLPPKSIRTQENQSIHRDEVFHIQGLKITIPSIITPNIQDNISFERFGTLLNKGLPNHSLVRGRKYSF